MYNLNNWYWAVVGNSSQVFSSASMSFIPVDDATYEAWLEEGRFATPIDNNGDLYGVLLEIYTRQLDPLDAILPRAVEDLITTYAFDPTKLPAAQQTRLTEKAAIRANIAALKETLGL